ncbi:copper amine oxidase N-terminal domain-containing protein [Paenibacillus sp. JX-17]|uniref:Copper amine oxidase N-terminal domain-containing protein n=1 Tax=Paenibacillus lacisoli TaxID=3064525 RepID=A0ABT9CCL2_9BACL|nr:copper amine oxidase N-terminal domain-containing protein [Paenibacillus sp. JX-17]MDO7906967.1 copper amine oxidase N-terminal domain-containing protein [Paenibacillus sp. JX-17]
MKKMLSAAAVSILLAASLGQAPAADAAQPIQIYINGVQLKTAKAPTMIGNRTLVPLRAIFEALNAEVLWNQKTQTVTATKGSRTVVLKIGSKTAIVNNGSVQLDVPAKNLNGYTMVPVRFVSEALGEDVKWNPSTMTVTVTTDDEVTPVASVVTSVTGSSGNGGDLEVSFTRVSDESVVDHYRIIAVKAANASSFTLDKARSLNSNNYTPVFTSGTDPSIPLNSQTRDSDGDVLRSSQSYVFYIMTVGNDLAGSRTALSRPSAAVQVPSGIVPVNAPSGVAVSDVSDYGDGRDLSVSFNRAQNEANIAQYRVFVVKTRDAGSFNNNTANQIGSSSYTAVNKTGGNPKIILGSSSRDTAGELIRTGVPYTVFVQSISSNSSTAYNNLSASSASITLNGSSVPVPVITSAADVSNYGDSRDLRVEFNRSADESRISQYRVFVVRQNAANSFNISAALSTPSGRYVDIPKTGGNIQRTLPAGLQDSQGNTIRNGEVYRIFVMAVSNNPNSYSHALAYSSLVELKNSSVGTASRVSVSDVSDYNDGRDLEIAFNRAANETNLDHYRVLVVKSANANRFDLEDAKGVSGSNYTKVNRTGSNLRLTLASGSRDVDGSLLRSGVSYRVFILSSGGGSGTGSYALSEPSSEITLSSQFSVEAARNVKASSDQGNIKVTFDKPGSETGIAYYEVIAVPSSSASGFDLQDAERVTSGRYITLSVNDPKTVTLSTYDVDANGGSLKEGAAYRIFVLSVADGKKATVNRLSSPSAEVMLEKRN